MAIPCKVVNVTCPVPTLAFNVISIDKLAVTIDVNDCNPGMGATWQTNWPTLSGEDYNKIENIRVGRHVYTFSKAGTYTLKLVGSNSCGLVAQAIKTVTVSVPLLPANITATSMTATPDTCVSPCGVSVSVTWSNIGELGGTFPPTIKVNTAVQTLPNVTVAPGASVTSTFTVFGLAPGTYTICPVPN